MRSEIRSRSTSANGANRVVMTLDRTAPVSPPPPVSRAPEAGSGAPKGLSLDVALALDADVSPSGPPVSRVVSVGPPVSRVVSVP